MAKDQGPPYTTETILELLKDDNKVKLAGLDVDGILRGKMISIDKFRSVITGTGFGFCSVVFGWDMHDKTYFKELLISNKDNGYHDVIAKVDLDSFRRIPWEDNVPFFLVSFYDPDTDEPLAPCPRGLLKTSLEKFQKKGMGAMAGAEYEFFQFLTTPNELAKSSSDLTHITPGMFGYSLTRPILFQSYYYDIYNSCLKFRCPIEGWHTESGPGVYEAALAFTNVQEMADRASLFKLVVKSLGNKNGIVPCFMAKPKQGLPGNSGHLHISIIDKESGKNLFARDEKDPNPPYPDLAYVSDIGRQFLAGLVEGLPSIMPLLAPTINSYKRLVENFWAPVTVSWGLEHRAASIRLIGPPTASAKATRFEVRVPGADCNPHYALSGILACGFRGIDKKLDISIPPLGKGEEGVGLRLAKTLREATEKFMAKDSIAREVLGDVFVDHYGGTREHEVRVWDEAVTDWETKRYTETV